MSDFLATPLQYVKGVGPRRAADLERVGLQTVEDLLLRFPLLIACAIAAACGALPLVYLKYLQARRLARFELQLPEALDLIARIQRAQDHLHHLYEEVRSYAAPLNHHARQRWDLRLLLRQSWDDLTVQRKDRTAQLRRYL